MADIERAKELFRQYGPKMGRYTASTFTCDNLPEDILDTAKRNFAPEATRENTLGMLSESLLDTGRSGIIFTDKKIYFSSAPFKPLKLWLDEIIEIKIDGEPDDDDDNKLIFNLVDGTEIAYTDTMLRKKPFVDFVNEMLERHVYSEITESHIDSTNTDNGYGVDAVGAAATSFGVVVDKSTGNIGGADNLLYDEYKWKGSGAHGFAAERANNLYDRVKGVDARITGDNNVANGPDRVLINNGEKVWIQSKYYNTGNSCIDDCFKDGKYRYYEDGKPMQVEVPSNNEIYNEAISRMEAKIKAGQVPGVTDPKEAKSLVRRGTVSYEQAVNIAKAGTVDSLIYDTVNGMVISTSAFGVSVLVSFAMSIWNGESVDDAISKAAASGIKVGGVALCTTVLSSQLYKAGASNLFTEDANALVSIIGRENSHMLINVLRAGDKIKAAYAQKALAKMLRGNALTTAVAIGVLSTFDLADAYSGRISESQLTKNIVSTSSSIIGGMGGYLGGLAIGSLILPGAGTIIAGLIGSVAVGSTAGAYTKNILDLFIKDDSEEMIHILDRTFCDLGSEYIINQDEAEKITDKFNRAIDGKMLKEMFASADRYVFAREKMVPFFDEIVKRRKHIKIADDEIIEKEMLSLIGEMANA